MGASVRPAAKDQGGPNPLALALLVSLLVFGFALLPRVFRGQGGALVGRPAPDFTVPAVLNALDGKAQFSLGDVRGRPVILDFWATWCGPCRVEAPLLDRVAKRFAERGLVVVGVNTNDEEGLAEAWARRTGLSYPIVYDTDSSVARTYQVASFPTLVVVNREGAVHAVRVGVTDEGELDRIVRQIL
jgi:thiol-disulfide isomerase/thioredoxin